MPRSPQALFVSYSSVLGGAERILLDRATALSGPAAVACPAGALADAARERGLEVAELKGRRAQLRGSTRDRAGAALRLAAQATEVRAATRDLSPGCVVGWSMRGLLSSAAAMSTVRGAPPLVFAQNDLLPSPGVARAVRASARRAVAVVALSGAIAQDLGLEAVVIHPGVDLQRFALAPPPAEGRRVLVLGAIVGWKRPDLALEIVARTDATLHLAGAPLDEAGQALLKRLRMRAEQPDLRGRVEIPGTGEDAAPALAAADCLLHCADREPFGMVMAEALARGRPVAAPASAGPLEIVDRSCGALYRPGDADAGAHALSEVLERAPELAAPARARAEERFDVRDSNRRFAELIAHVAR